MLKSFFKKAWTEVTNPGQDERVKIILSAITRDLQRVGKDFDLEKTIKPIDCTTKDVEVASNKYFEQLSERYWREGATSSLRRWSG